MSYSYSFVVYLYVNGSGSINSVGGGLVCLLLFACGCVVSVWRGFLFLWVLGMGYVILLWHSLDLPYNYFSKYMTIYFRPGLMGSFTIILVYFLRVSVIMAKYFNLSSV